MRAFALALVLLASIATSARAEITWSGSAGTRYLVRLLDDGLEAKNNSTQNRDVSKLTNKRFEYRATLAAGSKGESLDWGFDMRTQPTTSITTEWVSNAQNADFGVRLAQAYGRFHGVAAETDWAVTFGRAKTVMIYDNLGQSLFDNDVRWDGFGWTFKHGIFGFNASQYLLGAVSQGVVGASTYSRTEASDSSASTPSHFALLLSFQPWLQLKLNDDITTMFAVGYHSWGGTGGSGAAPSGSGFFTNAVHGGTANSSDNVAVGNVNPLIMDNVQQWQLTSDTSLPFNLRFVAEFVRNKKTVYGTRVTPAIPEVEAKRNAWAASLVWGKPKKAGDFLLGYSYTNKGHGSVINLYTNSDAPADNVSHFFESKYMLADGVGLGAKVQFHKEKSQLGGDGQPLAAPNNKRLQTQQRYELVTTAQF